MGRVYKIRNKETGEFWSDNFKLKRTAKTAYTQRTKWPNRHTFDEQDEYEIVEYILVEKEIYDSFIEEVEEYNKISEILEDLPINIKEVIDG